MVPTSLLCIPFMAITLNSPGFLFGMNFRYNLLLWLLQISSICTYFSWRYFLFNLPFIYLLSILFNVHSLIAWSTQTSGFVFSCCMHAFGSCFLNALVNTAFFAHTFPKNVFISVWTSFAAFRLFRFVYWPNFVFF